MVDKSKLLFSKVALVWLALFSLGGTFCLLVPNISSLTTFYDLFTISEIINYKNITLYIIGYGGNGGYIIIYDPFLDKVVKAVKIPGVILDDGLIYNNYLYVAGGIDHKNLYIAKFYLNLTPVWVKYVQIAYSYGNPYSNIVREMKVYNDTLYVFGDNGCDIFVLAINTTTGNITKHVYINTYGGGTTAACDFARDIDIDENGNIYLLGATWTPSTIYDILLVKFNNNLTPVWYYAIRGPGCQAFEGKGTIIYKDGYLIVADTAVCVGQYDIYIANISASDGSIIWQKVITTGAYEYHGESTLSYDGRYLYVYGASYYYAIPPAGWDTILLKIDVNNLTANYSLYIGSDMSEYASQIEKLIDDYFALVSENNLIIINDKLMSYIYNEGKSYSWGGTSWEIGKFDIPITDVGNNLYVDTVGVKIKDLQVNVTDLVPAEVYDVTDTLNYEVHYLTPENAPPVIDNITIEVVPNDTYDNTSYGRIIIYKDLGAKKIKITVVAHDPDNDPITYNISFHKIDANMTLIANSNTNQLEINLTPLPYARYKIYITVSDNYTYNGIPLHVVKYTSEDIILTWLPFNLTYDKFIVPEYAKVGVKVPVCYEANVTLPSDTTLILEVLVDGTPYDYRVAEYNFYDYYNGIYANITKSAVIHECINVTFYEEGNHTVSLRVIWEDPTGITYRKYKTFYVSVVPNIPPNITELSIEGAVYDEKLKLYRIYKDINKIIIVIVNVTDPDDTNLTYYVSIYNDTGVVYYSVENGTNTYYEKTINISSLDIGYYKLNVTVADPAGGSDTKIENITVIRSPYVAIKITPQTVTLDRAKNVTLNISVYGYAFNGTLYVTYLNNTIYNTSVDGFFNITFSYNITACPDKTYTFKAIVNDGYMTSTNETVFVAKRRYVYITGGGGAAPPPEIKPKPKEKPPTNVTKMPTARAIAVSKSIIYGIITVGIIIALLVLLKMKKII